MDERLLLPEVQDYLNEHLHFKITDFALKKHPFDIPAAVLAQQLSGMQTASYKFPELAEVQNIIYPPKLNLEQTSSSTTAGYKAILAIGNSVVDLTGGFGIDSSAFAKAGKSTTHIEQNCDLQQLAEQLFKAQDLRIQCFCTNGIDYINHKAGFDTIYLDPGRRNTQKGKVIDLADYKPNVLEHLDLLIEKCNRLLIKTSPMMDLAKGIQQLKYVTELHIVAVKNEVKELLWCLEKNHQSPKVHCVNLESCQPNFSFDWSSEIAGNVQYSSPQEYLYEPNAAIMKSQAFEVLAEVYNLSKLARLSHLFTSDKMIDFPGRIFRVKETMPYKPKSIKKQLTNDSRSIITRNFPMNSEQLKTKFKLGESDDYFAVFTTLADGHKILIDCERVN
jgi:hypothetical protein